MKKGFTLIELLGVVVILSIMVAITYPIITNNIKKNNEVKYNNLINSLEESALTYSTVEEYRGSKITFEQLINKGYITNISNPLTNTDLVGCLIKTIENDGTISYKYGTDCDFTAIDILNDYNKNKVADIGDIIKIGNEEFYVISNDNNDVTLLSKYNLYIGYNVTSNNVNSIISTNIQDQTALAHDINYPYVATINFANVDNIPNDGLQYVFDDSISISIYINKYKTYLESWGATIKEARLIKLEELTALGCNNNTCLESPHNWIYSTSYWTGNLYGDGTSAFGVYNNGNIINLNIQDNTKLGLRPVIVINANDIN